ncbi:Carbonyl reductase-like 20beta-hydroxysteroid dehydrogenase, related [Eimeria tenella]|uniref:Carbonyl reductase-like 20beta-hydroxysteroid dehydrogenase, related n=1 Tax=Eimeria tenella TaxID=5802 RepID=U6KIN3_EIMTE|nr:Carbonyl reductase-like 20beta-hydroxysteroid dehydrogenase, related [Eimeria tenella]CDJ37799.1 Carbonyl reductase-like 20beta-hydroxysteroid dehydrogenase, related [Eimeria tenella]|eukprot:XP_013228637.1 Carbonyl reductase-like 20beta-hydroxysteroid dehydrogenase, related [Eimeria tenella]
MAFFLSAKWAWVALQFVLKRREELQKMRKRGIVVVIIGGTTGLDMAIVHSVCSRLTQIETYGVHSVIITTKNETEGVTSLELLRHPTVRVGYHQLDASNKESLMAFCQHFKEQFESIDILINNAGMLPSAAELGCKGDTETVMNVNYYDAKLVTFTLLPLMAPGGRIIVAASGLAELAIRWMNNETFTKLFSETSTEDDIDGVAGGFVKEICDSSAGGKRVHDALAYPFAQASRIALTQYLGNQLKWSSRDPAMRVTACSFTPGWCRTPSGSNRAPFSAAEGAEEAVYAAFDADAETIQGSFLIGRKPARFGDGHAVAVTGNSGEAHTAAGRKTNDDTYKFATGKIATALALVARVVR